ncbi:hypothetical protein [Methylorubrum sp. POS3]|uniref:hypothetical protein n=1 Tax=Methylorubrum sp. POS3 TaxID=2998492 RepID=UPI003726913A
MPRPLPARRAPRHTPPPRPNRSRLPWHRAHGGRPMPARTSDLVLAVLGVVLLGGLALAAAFAAAA